MPESDKKVKRKEGLLSQFFNQASQTAVLTVIGTLISQVINSYNSHQSAGNPVPFDVSHVTWDRAEVQVMALLSIFYITPIIMLFLQWLSKVKGGIAVKLFIDQVIFSPPFTAVLIGLRLYFLNGVEVGNILPMLVDIVPNATKTGWMFWGPARLAIMMFLDESLHQLAGNLLSIVWTVIFALMLS